MKMFSNCSGPCETCANNQPNMNCLAGHGDDHYVPIEIKFPTPLYISVFPHNNVLSSAEFSLSTRIFKGCKK